MLYLLGAGMVVTGFFGMGMQLCKREESKLMILEEWKISLQILCNEISLRKQPVIFAIRECTNKLRGEVKDFYGNLSMRLEKRQEQLLELWEEELNRYLGKTILSSEEKGVLEHLVNILGFQDQKMQLGMLQREIERIDRYKKEAEVQFREKKKMILLLSTCSGVVLVLLLI